VIQISTPTQEISSTNSIHENPSIVAGGRESEGDSAEIQSSGHKKGKLGVFAKLLEGLISKTKTGATETDSKGAEANVVSGAEKVGKNTFNTINLKIDNKENLAGELGSAAISAFFEKATATGARPQAEGAQKAKTAQLDLNSALNRKDLAQLKEFSDSAQNQKEGATLTARADDSRDTRNQGLSRSETVPWLQGKDRGRNSGTTDFINVSFRDLEAKLSQAQPQLNQARNADAEKDNSRFSRTARNRFNLEVRDFRTGSERVQAAIEAQNGQVFNAVKPVSTETNILVNLNNSEGNGDALLSLKAGKENPQGKIFEDALAKELRSGLSNEIVRDATLILKNGGEGTIKLSLRPASLGDVKVRLEMTENKITGYIIVESSEALRAFERELPVLEKAFKDSGFSETNLEMSLAQDQWNFSAGDEQQEDDFQSVSPVLAAGRYEVETELIGDPPIEGDLYFSAAGSRGRTPVNLLV